MKYIRNSSMLPTIKSNDTCYLFSGSKANLLFIYSHWWSGLGIFGYFWKLFICSFHRALLYISLFCHWFSIFSSLNFPVFGWKHSLLKVEAVTGISCSNVSPKWLHTLISLFKQFATVEYLWLLYYRSIKKFTITIFVTVNINVLSMSVQFLLA